MNPNHPSKRLSKEVIEKLANLHTADTAQMPENRTIGTISPEAYPPYPRNKLAYINVMQTAINKANVRGYDEGRKDSRERCQEDILNKMINALCKESTALAERKY